MSDLYFQAGVNIDAGNEVVRQIKADVASTHTKEVLTGIGGFGGLYDVSEILKKYKNPVLVQSIDGVGTKLSVARMMNKYDTVGEDIVNHCCDDLLAMGARSLTFLDYVAHDKLDSNVMESMVSGMSKACRENNISLIGGETAEMPGIYMKGEHDIAGCITGIVEKNKIITGEKIEEGDIILGFPSSGLHTNGFSLARKLFFEKFGYDINTKIDELGETVGKALLKIHVNYSLPVLNMIDDDIDIHGIAHITGGGFIENIPRVLPLNFDAEIQKNTWPMIPIFPYMQKMGNIEEQDMYRTFNMGIGLILIVSKKEKIKIEKVLLKYQKFKIYEIGKIIKGHKKVILV